MPWVGRPIRESVSPLIPIGRVRARGRRALRQPHPPPYWHRHSPSLDKICTDCDTTSFNDPVGSGDPVATTARRAPKTQGRAPWALRRRKGNGFGDPRDCGGVNACGDPVPSPAATRTPTPPRRECMRPLQAGRCGRHSEDPECQLQAQDTLEMCPRLLAPIKTAAGPRDLIKEAGSV